MTLTTQTAYPAHVAAEITARRPDLRTTDGIDAIRTILTATPTLTAQDAIEIIDEATADTAAEAHIAAAELQVRLNLHTVRVDALEREERDLSDSLRETRELLARARASQGAFLALIAAVRMEAAS